jgi:hypothetical protein
VVGTPHCNNRSAVLLVQISLFGGSGVDFTLFVKGAASPFTLPTYVAHLSLPSSVSTPGLECYVEGASRRAYLELGSG